MAGPRLAVALTLRDTVVVDAAAQYRHLVGLGKDEFLAAAAPAALVRYRAVDLGADSGEQTLTIDDAGQETMPIGKVSLGDVINIEVYPLVKKPGASFPDRITIGRTANNDIVLAEASISRLHAYLRRQGAGWVVADGGSKNGSWLRGETLEPRREKPITSRTVLRLGDVDLTFYLAPDLYGVLGGG